ncbi:MAG: Cna B-type domain-containing protein [Oscillospiraceae bacterium]|nr:Cna B-type domain-containing protein [Oscillospiraceae bacterium]
MNDVQKFVNGILRNHSMHKRYIAVLTALSMVVSIVVTSILVMPADSKAGSLICEKTEHIHDESCKKLVCGLDEVIYDEVTTEAVSQAIGQFVQLAQLEGETVGDAKTEASVEVTESSEVVEGTESIIEATEETVVSESASESAGEISEDTNEDTVPQVTESVQHIHTDECYMYVCGFEEHTHSEDCYESVEVDPTPDEVDSYMINQNAFDVFNVFGRPMHLLYEDVSVTSEHSTENNPDSTMQVNPGAILGVATHFHVLAEEAAFQSHVHGNVATNHLIQCGAFGVYLNKLAGKSSVNYIKKFDQYAPLDNAYQTKLVLGSEYSVTQEANRYKITDKSGNQYYIPVSNFPEGGSLETDIEVNENYINVTKELDKFADMSRAIAAKESKETVYIDDASKMGTENKVYIIDNGSENYILDFTNITDKYIYYTLDLTKNDRCNDPNGQPLINFSTCSKVLEIKGITEDKFLFLTVDVGDIETNSNIAFNKSWKVYRADDQSQVYGTGEVPLDDGSCRVIYNIVNSTTSDGVKEYTPFGEKNGMPTDAKIILGEQKNGTFLVPRGYVNCAGNTNGTIIAYKYVATGESHRADIQFEDEEVDDVDCPTTSENVTSSGGSNTQQQNISITVNKVWNDGNENHQNDNVEIQLYKAYESNLDINDTSLIGTSLTESKIVLVKKNDNTNNQITLNPSNNWTAKFENLPVKDKIDDQTEKLIYYYIKEVNKEGYTATYSANGLNTVDRTVTVRNVKLMDLVIKKQWHKSDGTLITASDVDDNNNNILSSMPSVECTLYKSNIYLSNNLPTDAEMVETFSIGGEAWQYTKAQLPTEEDGKPLYYYVMEKPVDGYNVSYENVGYLGSESIIVKNTQKASGTISLTVNKRWLATDVSGVIDYTSPVKTANIEVTVELQKSTDGVNWSYADSAKFTTSYTFTNLRKQENGTDIYYRVKELNVPYGYQDLYSKTSVKAQDVTDNGEATITVTNTLIKNSLTIKKNWYNDDSRGISSIIVEVYRKLAGANNNPQISGTGESVPEDDPIIPPDEYIEGSQNGTLTSDGKTLVFSERQFVDGKIEYDISAYEGCTVTSITVWSSPVSGTQGYNGMISIGTQNCNYSGDGTSNCKYSVPFNNSDIVISKTNNITIMTLTDNANVKHVINRVEVQFMTAFGEVIKGQANSFIRDNWLLFATVNYNSELTISNINDSLSNTTFSYDGLTGTYPAYKVTISESDSNTSKYYGNTLTSLLASCQANSGSSCEVAVLLLKNNTVVEWIHTMVSSSDSKFTFKNGGCYIETGNTYDIYVFKYSETENSNFRINNATCNFSTGNTTTDGEDEYTTGNTTHNFTTNGTLSSFYNISGELSTNKDTQYYNGLTLTQCLKINSKASISFSVSENYTGKLILVFGGSNGESFYIDNTLYTVDDDGVLEIDNLSTGSHTIKQNSGNEPDLFYMTYSETVVENQKKDEVTFENNVLTVIPANAKGEDNKYYQNNDNYFKNAWGYQIPSEHRGKTITNIKVTFGSNVNGAEICILTNKNQDVTQAYWDENYTNNNSNNSPSFEWSNISYTIPTTYSNYSLYVIEVGDINSNGNNSDNLQEYTITKLEITFASENIISRSKDIYLNNIASTEFSVDNSEQYLLTNSELSEFSSKFINKIELTYNNDLSSFPDSNTQTNLWIQGPNGYIAPKSDGSGYLYSGKVATLVYDSVAVSNLSEIRIKTAQSPEINNIKVIFTDGSTYTVTNKCSGIYNTTSKNDQIDVTIAGDNNDNASIVNLNNSPLSDYKGKYLDYIQVYLKNSYNEVPAESLVNLYIHKAGDDYGVVPQISRSQNGNITTYNYGGVATHDAVNLRSDFFRLKTTINTEIQKVVLVFSDNTTFTMNNKSYVASTTPSTKLEKSKEVEIKYDTEQYNLITKSELSEYLNKKITRLETFYDNVKDIELNSTTFIHLRGTDGNQKSHDGGQGIDENNNSGYFSYNSWGLDQLNDNLLYLKTTVNEKIHKIVFTFDDSSTYTLINTTYNLYAPPADPDEPDEPKIEHLERDITINKSLYGDTLHENRGYWNDDNHEGFGFYNDEHKNAYADKYFHSVQIYYRDMLLGFPDYQKDTKVYLLRSSEINGSWCPDQTGYGFDDNIATWYYGSESGEIASNLGNEFFKIKTSRPDEISKVVICFTDGSTYTMNNTAYVASSKVESSEDDYTYNTGEYVLIAKITLTADGGWRQTLDNLPATDGQGNAYTYHIKETNIYGSEADKYKVLSYTHANGIVLENDSNDIGVTNARNDDESIIVLPNTGGTGTKGYFIAGIIVMICSAAGYTVIKRRLIR